MEQTGVQQTGFMTLQAPTGQKFTHVHLASGRIVSPDSRGMIVVTLGDARPLMGAGWTIVQ
jgi:hypothetical protein